MDRSDREASLNVSAIGRDLAAFQKHLIAGGCLDADLNCVRNVGYQSRHSIDTDQRAQEGLYGSIHENDLKMAAPSKYVSQEKSFHLNAVD